MAVIKELEVVIHIATNLEAMGKRNFSNAMETKEEEISEIAKRQNIEAEGELVEVFKSKSKKGKVKVKGLAFEVNEYAFSEVPEASTDKFKSIADLYDKNNDDKVISLNESLKLY